MRPDKITLPEDWELSLLDKVTTRGSGHTPDKKKPSYWNGGIKWISLADSSKLDKVYIAETDKEISDLGIKNSSAVLHKKGTVLLSRDAGVGKSAIMAEDMAVSQHFIAWECSQKNKLDNLYLYYWLQMLKPEFERIAVGSTIKTIGLPYFKKFKLPHPSLAEQKKISKVINQWDIGINELNILISSKKKRKKGLMSQILNGSKRISGFDADWVELKIKDMGKVVSGGTPSTTNSNYWDGEIAWCTPTEITKLKTRFISDTSRKITSEGLANSSAKLLPPGSIIVCTRATIGYCAINTLPMTTNQGFKNLVPNKNHSSDFLYYLIKHFTHEFMRFASGSTFLEISKTDFENRKFKVPALEEQQKIAHFLSTLSEEIFLLEQKRDKFEVIKKGLMQKLLTGKVRFLNNRI